MENEITFSAEAEFDVSLPEAQAEAQPTTTYGSFSSSSGTSLKNGARVEVREQAPTYGSFSSSSGTSLKDGARVEVHEQAPLLRRRHEPRPPPSVTAGWRRPNVSYTAWEACR